MPKDLSEIALGPHDLVSTNFDALSCFDLLLNNILSLAFTTGVSDGV